MADLDGISGSIDPKLQLGMINNNFQRIRNESRTKIYKDKTQQIVMLLGKLAATDTHGMITYNNGVPSTLIDENGIKVAQSGVDVTTATDDQLVMSSDFNMLKIVATGSSSITTFPGGAQIVNIPHNLGDIPVSQVYIEFNALTNFRTALPFMRFNNPNVTTVLEPILHISYRMDATDLTISAVTAAGQTAETLDFKYFIMVETAS